MILGSILELTGGRRKEKAWQREQHLRIFLAARQIFLPQAVVTLPEPEINIFLDW